MLKSMKMVPSRAKILLQAAALAPLVALGFCLPPPTDAESVPQRGDPGIVVRNADVKSEPEQGSDTVATVTLGDRVTVTRLRGPWAMISLPDAENGWVPAINVRLGGEAAQRNGTVTGWLRRITGAVSGAPGSQESASMGIRGLEPSDVANAEPNPAELRKLDQYRATPAAAGRYARDLRLRSREVAYIDAGQEAPPKPARATGADTRH